MGMFLSMTGVVGKTKNEVINSLSKYAPLAGGGFEKADLSIDSDHCCVIDEANGNTTVFNPYSFLDWDQSSEFISRDLSTPVFSFHIHDGDFWMYTLFVNGEIVDQFNPIPEYWDDSISAEEIESWRGDAAIVVKYVRSGTTADIEKYLVHWDMDEELKKAYADDEFVQEDWQLLDFMKKLGLPYPLDDDGKPKSETFKLWTPQPDLRQAPMEMHRSSGNMNSKPWCKFW